MTKQERLKRLKAYLEKCEIDVKTMNKPLAMFFKRELEKTKKKIEELTQ